jgi:hypothetical protein
MCNNLLASDIVGVPCILGICELSIGKKPDISIFQINSPFNVWWSEVKSVYSKMTDAVRVWYTLAPACRAIAEGGCQVGSFNFLI